MLLGRNMAIPRLDLREVTYAVNGKRIIDRVSWVVVPGEHWAILGPNGSGKTTLLRLACGYLWPNAGGEIYRQGETLLNLTELRKSIGWVTSTLVTDIPRREVVLDTVVSGKYAQLGLREYPGFAPRQSDFEKAREYLKDLGCENFAGRFFGTLSQGEQQKVLICRARMTDPYLIILDEPCAGMDPGAREVFLSSLSTLGENGDIPSLVYVTHHVEEILPIFKKTLLLKDGRILRSGRTDDVLVPQTLQQLYGVSMDLIRKDGRYWPIPELVKGHDQGAG
jgi:iron complex transport system ATP-binding protein